MCRHHHQVKLPWKDEHGKLCDNFELSKNRLTSLLKRLRHTPKLLQEYDSIINEQEGRIQYIPDHAVVRTDKSTTKIRIVYDASAKGKNGTSLNNCLHKGLKFDQNIINNLIHFRVHRVAFSTDTEKAFLMVGIDEEDWNILQFLWVDNILTVLHLKLFHCILLE